MIVSNQITEDDFYSIKRGYELNNDYIKSMLGSFDEYLTLNDIKNLSNLSYYIAKGMVEIKIVYTMQGIFHDKCVIFIDEVGNEFCVRGSNN